MLMWVSRAARAQAANRSMPWAATSNGHAHDPTTSGPSNVKRLASQASDVGHATRSASLRRNGFAARAASASRVRCVCTTPRGVPVVPDV